MSIDTEWPGGGGLHAGRYPSALGWDGTEWDGPGETGAPHGPAFGPGVYQLMVIATGTHERRSRSLVR